MNPKLPHPALLLALFLGLAAQPLCAQFTMSTPPGRLGVSPTRRSDMIEDKYNSARWTLGTLRVDPQLNLKDLAYYSEVIVTPEGTTEVEDYTGGIGAGLVLFQKLGPKAMAEAFVAANYYWWSDRAELRDAAPSYGIIFYGLFNKADLELQLGRVEQQQILSSETEFPVQTRDDRATLRYEVEFKYPWSVFGTLGVNSLRYPDSAKENLPSLNLGALERDTDRASIGIQYAILENWTVGIGARYHRTTFVDDIGGRDNNANGPFVRTDYSGDRLTVTLLAVLRSIEFENREPPESTDQTTGNLRIGWRLGPKTLGIVYAGRNLQFSALDLEDYFISTRVGGRLERQLSERLRLDLFYEAGPDEYSEARTGTSARSDDLQGAGAVLGIEISRKLSTGIGVRWVDRDSSLDPFDRTTTSLRLTVRYGDDLLPW